VCGGFETLGEQLSQLAVTPNLPLLSLSDEDAGTTRTTPSRAEGGGGGGSYPGVISSLTPTGKNDKFLAMNDDDLNPRFSNHAATPAPAVFYDPLSLQPITGGKTGRRTSDTLIDLPSD